ncbi:hypothetical protein C9374_009547 [Naegleria lovaniensis]|uniref:40S ribosomal protein S6 n=1 Tax=Naegleria lovaniensis TaxID=51637 RepID=A0AA88H197_NAELO|nr:uncharacterized protein C9374_009547 [Naegleria lovaniensis]KAG2392970.1 hypothetical protein C9374_009547 [Naegleria lovaniensis]
MKLKISDPSTGCTKMVVIEEDAEIKLRSFFDRKMSEEVEGDNLGPEYKGYVFRIVGGQDKSGFAMKQGVLANTRVRLLLDRGSLGFQKWRGRDGERRRKSVRGCIVGPDLSVLCLTVVKKGDAELPGITDTVKPRTHGPKRASKIRKLFNLTKADDVRKYVIKRERKVAKNKKVLKGVKIQRLVTPDRIRRKAKEIKRSIKRVAASKAEKKAYAKLLSKRKAETQKKTEAAQQKKTEAAQKK